MSKTEVGRGVSSNYSALLPVSAVIVFMALGFWLKLAGFDSGSGFDPPYLLPVLNFVFACACPLFVSYVASRGYLESGSLSLLMLAAGVMTFGLGSLAAGFLLPGGGPTSVVTVHNCAMLLAGVLHFQGAVAGLAGYRTELDVRRRRHALLLWLLGVCMVLGLLVAAFLRGLLPEFFIQGQGSTLPRQVVLGASIFLFFASGILFLRLHRNVRSRFLHWYAMALLLIATGLTCVLNQKSVGSPLGWAGRTAQFIAGVYLVIAVFQRGKECHVGATRVDRLLAQLFRNQFELLLEERTAQLSRANEQLQQEIEKRQQMETRLRESQARLRHASQAAEFGTYMYDFETGTGEWSPELKALWGLGPDDPVLLDKDGVILFIHPADRAAMLAAITQANASEGDGRLEMDYRVIWPDGQVRWLHVRGRTEFMGEGLERRPWRAAGAVVDITASKIAEQRLADARNYISTLLQISPVGLVTYKASGEVISANREVARLVGTTVENVLKQNFRELASWRNSGLLAMADKALATGQLQWGELQMVTTFGRKLWLSCRFVPFEFGGESHLLLMAADISERKLAAEALRKSEQKFSDAFRLNPDSININRLADGVYLDVNEGFERITGYKREEVIGRTSREDGLNLWANPQDRIRLVEELTRCGEVAGLEAEFRFKNGRVGIGLMSARMIEIDGQTCILSITRDITEARQMEARFRQTQKMEAVGRLAGGIAHDFNNMLGVILGHTEFAMDQVEPGHPLHGSLEGIRKAANHSADLARQLLAFARRQTVVPQVLDLNETVSGTLKMLGRLIGENIQLVWQPGADLWPVRVDPSQVDQILANLCVNGRDAITGTGEISIETANATFTEEDCIRHVGFLPGEYVMLAVRDTGCGMDEVTQSHLFEPFFTTKDVGKGTGLGLATVYGAVQQNGGFIDFTSAPGQGTRFAVYLPRHAGIAAPAPEPAAAGPAAPGQETILLVEDERGLLKLITMMLTRNGYSVLAACTPSEAMRMARDHAGTIDLLMTDVVMPEMNGLELARRLQVVRPQLKSLFMSGYTADILGNRGVLDDTVHFLEKPWSAKVMLAKVREALDGDRCTIP